MGGKKSIMHPPIHFASFICTMILKHWGLRKSRISQSEFAKLNSCGKIKKINYKIYQEKLFITTTFCNLFMNPNSHTELLAEDMKDSWNVDNITKQESFHQICYEFCLTAVVLSLFNFSSFSRESQILFKLINLRRSLGRLWEVGIVWGKA